MAKIGDDDPNYPKYFITFDGELIKGGPIRVNGPHTFVLPPLPPDFFVTLDLTRSPAEPGIPELKITVNKKTKP